MCGIYGIISRRKHGLISADQDILKQMMLDTVQRGDDSSGLFMTDYRDPNVLPTGVKVVGGPHNIIYNPPLWKEIERFLQQHAGAVIGHGRWATRGNVTAENAHPFQHEHITMVHNGTIHSGVSYAKKGDTSIEVDSHALCVSMAEKGILEALAHVRGAYAVIVHDAKDGALYVARNDERPLYIYSAEDRHYLMSEGVVLDMIMTRYNKKVKDVPIMYFKSEALIKFDLRDPEKYTNVGDIGKRRIEIEAAEAAERAKKYAASVPATSGHARHGGYNVSPKPDTKERYKPVKVPVEVTFAVDRFEPFGTNFKYYCHSTTNEPVTFISDQAKPEYLKRIGKAPIHSFVSRADQHAMFVRHRAIEWIDHLEDEPVGEEPANAGTFLTYNNKRINADVWASRIRDQGCLACDATFRQTDARNAVLTDDNDLLCIPCAREFSVGQQKTVH